MFKKRKMHRGNNLPENESIVSWSISKPQAVTLKESKVSIDPSLLENVSLIQDPILATVQKHKRQPSIHKGND